MTLDEWKDHQSQVNYSQYTHFDYRVSLNKCFKYITSPEKIAHHGFYPFIHYTQTSNKVKDGQKCEPKLRQIYYAAHIDSWIYRYCAYVINEAYNSRLETDGLFNVAVAYRTNLGKSNIDFAKMAFDAIQNIGSCYVMIGDFTDFFDNLDHKYLKSQLCGLLAVDTLPEYLYAVYKQVTRFSYVELQDLLALNGLENNRQGQYKFNRLLSRALSSEDFRRNKHIIHKPSKDRGIPQGSPISAVLANVYMLSADKELQQYVSSLNGLYMRYSDDFIVVIPRDDINFTVHHENIHKILKTVPKLELKPEKTKIFCFENMSVKNCTGAITGSSANEKHIIEFLGLAFDGKNIRLRDKTISRYYNKLHSKTRTIVKALGVTPKGNRISCKELYNRYSYKGSEYYLKRTHQRIKNNHSRSGSNGNFLDYVYRARNKFGSGFIETITKRHMQKIRKCLKKIP